MSCSTQFFFFFFNDTATTEIYTLSLHDALPICCSDSDWSAVASTVPSFGAMLKRSEEHTSELQSRLHLVCRLLLEKNNQRTGIKATQCARSGLTRLGRRISNR